MSTAGHQVPTDHEPVFTQFDANRAAAVVVLPGWSLRRRPSTRPSAQREERTAAAHRMAPTGAEADFRALPCPGLRSGIEVDDGKESSSGRNCMWSGRYGHHRTAIPRRQSIVSRRRQMKRCAISRSPSTSPCPWTRKIHRRHVFRSRAERLRHGSATAPPKQFFLGVGSFLEGKGARTGGRLHPDSRRVRLPRHRPRI